MGIIIFFVQIVWFGVFFGIPWIMHTQVLAAPQGQEIARVAVVTLALLWAMTVATHYLLARKKGFEMVAENSTSKEKNDLFLEYVRERLMAAPFLGVVWARRMPKFVTELEEYADQQKTRRTFESKVRMFDYSSGEGSSLLELFRMVPDLKSVSFDDARKLILLTRGYFERRFEELRVKLSANEEEIEMLLPAIVYLQNAQAFDCGMSLMERYEVKKKDLELRYHEALVSLRKARVVIELYWTNNHNIYNKAEGFDEAVRFMEQAVRWVED